MSTEFENRLTALEQRLSKIEAHLSLPDRSPEKIKVAQTAVDDWADDIETLSSPLPKISHPITENEKPFNWLGIAAIFCFVLAAGFIIKLSIDSGWLTPARQIGLSALLGLGLIGSGLRLLSSDKEYASFLPAAGIIILYLTSLAGHTYYNLISFEGSLALVGLVSALCVGLYTKIRHDVYAITASLGAYVSPLLLGGKSVAEFSLSYFLMASLAFGVISIFVKSRLLLLISANLAILMTAVIGFDLNQNLMVSIVLALHFLIFSCSTYFYSKHNNSPLEADEAWGFFPVLLAFYAMEYYFINQISPELAPLISLSFSGFLLGLYLSAKRLFPNGLGSQSLILAFTTLVCFHSIYVELLPPVLHPWLLVIILISAAFIPNTLISKKQTGIYSIPLIAIAIIAVIEYFSIIIHLLDTNKISWVLVSMATLISFWILLINKSSLIKEKIENYYGLLGAAHILAIFSLYRYTNDIGSLAVSASWLCYAVAVMLFASTRKDEVMARSALVVLALAAGKALLYDAANAPTLLRIACLLMTGAVLYGCGFFMRRISTWTAVK
jgi:uncharacterized membrane protein